MRRHPSRIDNSVPSDDYQASSWRGNGHSNAVVRHTSTYSPMTPNPTFNHTSAQQRQFVHYQGQLQETSYRDFPDQLLDRSHKRLSSPDRRKQQHEGILYDYFESKPLTRDIYNNSDLPIQTSPTQSPSQTPAQSPRTFPRSRLPDPKGFENRARELEKRLPNLYPQRTSIKFEDDCPSVQLKEPQGSPQLSHQPVRHPAVSRLQNKPADTIVNFDSDNGHSTQLSAMRQPLIGSDDSINTYEDERLRRTQNSTPRHSISNGKGTKKRYPTGMSTDEDDVMQYIRDNKKKTVVDKDDVDIESQESRHYSALKLDGNYTFCERVQHFWRVLSDTRGEFNECIHFLGTLIFFLQKNLSCVNIFRSL